MLNRQHFLAALLAICAVSASNVAHAGWHYCTPASDEGSTWGPLPCGSDSVAYGIELEFRVNLWGESEVYASTNIHGLQYQAEAMGHCPEPVTVECLNNPPYAYGPAVTSGISATGIEGGVRFTGARYWVPSELEE